MIFLTISTRKSQYFTRPAIESLFNNTSIRPDDRVVVIDNDGTLEDIPNTTIIRNPKPRSFAENANFGIALSHVLNDDVLILNNDIIYTKNWLGLLQPDGTNILVPFCNQNAQYNANEFKTNFLMDFEEYVGHEKQLDEIAAVHFELQRARPQHVDDLLISFFCVYIPVSASRKIGFFDESFGRGGGEDVDYRLRAMKAGVDVKLAQHPYLLHFMGKSTWRSGEATQETRAVESEYRRRFIEKWGQPVADMFLAGGDKAEIARRYGVLSQLEAGDFVALFEALQSSNPPVAQAQASG